MKDNSVKAIFKWFETNQKQIDAKGAKQMSADKINLMRSG